MTLRTSFYALKTANTRRCYEQAIRDLESYLGRDAKFCTTDQALSYFAFYKKKHSPASVKHRYHILRAYFEFLCDLGEVEKNCFKIIGKVLSMRQQNQVRPTKTLTPKQVGKILTSLDLDKHSGRLLFAFIGLLFGGGLRRGEAASLIACNVKLAGKNGQSYVELKGTKSGTDQIQPIPSWLTPVLRQILFDRTKQGLPAKGRLFPWSEHSAYRRLKSHCQSLGYECAPHAFRAAAATFLKLQGCEDREVAEFLRHKTTTMVQVYDHRYRMVSKKTKHRFQNFLPKIKFYP